MAGMRTPRSGSPRQFGAVPHAPPRGSNRCGNGEQWAVLGDLQQLLDDKDICIRDMEGEIEEMRQLLEEAVVENDSLRCKLEKCKEMVLCEEDRAQAVRDHVAEMYRLMADGSQCNVANSCKPMPNRKNMSFIDSRLQSNGMNGLNASRSSKFNPKLINK